MEEDRKECLHMVLIWFDNLHSFDQAHPFSGASRPIVSNGKIMRLQVDWSLRFSNPLGLRIEINSEVIACCSVAWRIIYKVILFYFLCDQASALIYNWMSAPFINWFWCTWLLLLWNDTLDGFRPSSSVFPGASRLTCTDGTFIQLLVDWAMSAI